MLLTRLTYALALIIVGFGARFISTYYLVLGNVLAGIGVVMLVFLGLKFTEEKWPKATKIASKVITYGIVLFVFVFATTACAVIYGYQTGNEEKDEEAGKTIADEADYLIVLGNAFDEGEPTDLTRYRLEAALEYLEAYPDCVCIVSGGITEGNTVSEAEEMYKWLIGHGIDEDRLIKEEKALDTYQNIKYSYELIEAQNENASVAVVTGDYHVLRAKFTAKLQEHDPIMIGAETKGVLVKLNFYVREIFALWNRAILGFETA